jgi:phosphoribosylanthranilate isomerase
MNSTKVKICGITSLEDARAAVAMGANLLGFNFYAKSPRYVTVEQAAAMADELPAFVDLVGIFVNATAQAIRAALHTCSLDWIQLHGDETPDFCRGFDGDHVRIIKALRIKEASDMEQCKAFQTDAVLLDAFHPALYGGTGETFDWDLVAETNRRVFLAGGINPSNAAEAFELGLYSIDVCSGVESEPGIKDHVKMQTLFDNVRHLLG